ncbi:hypothetical protein BH23ACT10_BH23ACT10_30810 [soil metagenome]
MATTVEREEYDEHEYEQMREKLDQCVMALDVLLQQPGFGVGPQTLGAEVEYFLVDDDGHPLARNQEIHGDVTDERLTKEVIRYNVESNLTPVPLAGGPFDAMRREMDEIAGLVDEAATEHGGRTISIGTLPTLRSEDLGLAAVTDEPRYTALDTQLRRMRTQPHQIDIAGDDHLLAQANDVSLEGANTSFQLHVRVDPSRFVDVYNAAQIATAPVLAVSGNSPFFLGHRLWEETRIALFQQSVDFRDEHLERTLPPRVAFGRRWLESSAIEVFAEAVRTHDPILPILADEDPRTAVHVGKVPGLDELRMHLGAIWTWNRAIYDPNAGGHLRVELRALPAGPTAIDMVANGAFILGLTLAISDDAAAWTSMLSFDQARENFYRAAEHGLEAQLLSPFGDDGMERVSARGLALRLLAPAREALLSRDVESADIDGLFALLEERIRSGQTGAQWQRAAAAALEPRLGWDRALATTTRRYIDAMASGEPVHTWPLPAS